MGAVDVTVTRFVTEYGVSFDGRPRPASGGTRVAFDHGSELLNAIIEEFTAGSEVDKNGDTLTMSARARVAVEAEASFGDGPLAFSTPTALPGFATAEATSDLSADAAADASAHHTTEFTLGAPARPRIAVEAGADANVTVRLETAPFFFAVVQEFRRLDTPWSRSNDGTIQPGEYRLRVSATGDANAFCRNFEAADCPTSLDSFATSISATVRIDAAE